MLAAADAWLFVTTAARYADAVPWEYLRAARSRGTACPSSSTASLRTRKKVRRHLRSMLDEQGLEAAELLVVPETRLEDELLPAEALFPVRGWLDSLAADSQSRAALVRRTLEGALSSLPRAYTPSRRRPRSRSQLRRASSHVEQAYADTLEEVDTALRNGRSSAARCWRAGTRSSAPEI